MPNAVQAQGEAEDHLQRLLGLCLFEALAHGVIVLRCKPPSLRHAHHECSQLCRGRQHLKNVSIISSGIHWNSSMQESTTCHPSVVRMTKPCFQACYTQTGCLLQQAATFNMYLSGPSLPAHILEKNEAHCTSAPLEICPPAMPEACRCRQLSQDALPALGELPPAVMAASQCSRAT